MLNFVAFVESNQSHLIDHFVPFCKIINAPILLTQKNDFEIAKKFYPYSNFIYMDISDITEDYLVENFLGLIHSQFWNKEKFNLNFALSKNKFKKEFRSIYMPHGNSDKGHHYPMMENFPLQDISLVYGDKMIDFINEKSEKKLSDHIVIGNLRYHYFLENFEFYKSLLEDLILKDLDIDKKTILYAPTWNDYEGSSSFSISTQNLIEKIAEKYNLIIKIHPKLYDEKIGQIINLIEKHKNNKNIKILVDFPCIYPLLFYTDIYIGDYSSIGYDFLAFNRPMFFFNFQNLKKDDKKRFLHKYGIEILEKDLENLPEIIENSLKKEKDFILKRKSLYSYTFANTKPKAIRESLLKLCQK